MTAEPTGQPEPLLQNEPGRVLSPRLRLYLYGAAGIMVALLASLKILGAAGFVAFLVGMACAQLAFRLRPSLNIAFVAGLLAYALTLGVWSATVGPPGPGDSSATVTPTSQS